MKIEEIATIIEESSREITEESNREIAEEEDECCECCESDSTKFIINTMSHFIGCEIYELGKLGIGKK